MAAYVEWPLDAQVRPHHTNRLADSARAFIGRTAGVPVFHLEVLGATAIVGATAADGYVTSYGRGTFTGPIESGTAPEYEAILAQFPELADELRFYFEWVSESPIIISRVDLNGANYVAFTALPIRIDEDPLPWHLPEMPLLTE